MSTFEISVSLAIGLAVLAIVVIVYLVRDAVSEDIERDHKEHNGSRDE